MPAYPALAVTLFANAAVTLVYGRAVAAQVDRVADRQKVFQAYADMFGLLGSRHFEAPALRHLQEQLSAHGLSADVQMRRLGRLMPLADIRGVMFFFVVEIATLWSFHVLWLLERWKREAGSHARAWLEALGEAESLIALGTLSFDQPGWALPELNEGDSLVLRATSLAHPLLPSERAVGNDVEVGPPGTFLLVTGSNMSGKSTLLRAIGLNTVLAQMGGPVCASAMQLPPLAVASSMRVQDSLEQGISTFMAELRRLKAIVDLVQSQDCVSATVGAEPVDGPGVSLQPRQAAQLQGPASTRPFGRSAPLTPTDRSVGAADGSRPDSRPEPGKGRPVLYLLDEILQGTNTAEREIAARRIILRLVKAGAIGAVSTHDLTLAEAPEIARAAVPVHFSETFTRGPEGLTMTFDYRLRPGIATSTNALKLMELIGLSPHDGQESDGPG